MVIAHYTDTPLIATHLKRNLTANEEATLAVILPAVDKYINDVTGINFLQATDYETRYFEGDIDTLDIDAATDVQWVKEVYDDGTLGYAFLPKYEWLAYPLNETVKTEIKLRYGKFPPGDNRIAVNAKWSAWDADNPGVPEGIQMVATILAVDLLNLGKQGSIGNIKREDLEGHRVEYNDPTANVQSLADDNPIVQGILRQYTGLML